jgi:hypothetical protein
MLHIKKLTDRIICLGILVLTNSLNFIVSGYRTVRTFTCGAAEPEFNTATNANEFKPDANVHWKLLGFDSKVQLSEPKEFPEAAMTKKAFISPFNFSNIIEMYK